MKIKLLVVLTVFGFMSLFAGNSDALTVNYSGNQGLSASADFSLVDPNTLQIILTNTSVSPFADGGADMVLSSINFDLGSVLITGGNVALNAGSSVVNRVPPGSAWQTTSTGDLNDQYGYSNTGIGNSPSPFPNALHSVTSHSGGGTASTTFNGSPGVPGGLDYGLVAQGSTGFGVQDFILDSIIITLFVDTPLADLSFLSRGSYVEFGSDFSYVPAVPEPATLILMGGGLVALAAKRKRRTNQPS